MKQMAAGKRFILSEYPFSNKQRSNLESLANKYSYKVITIRLVADFDALWARRKVRDIENDRHLSHIMSHYHFGDVLEDRSKADSLITEEEFRNIIEARQYNEFSLGELHEYDVSDFSKVDYTDLLEKLRELS